VVILPVKLTQKSQAYLFIDGVFPPRLPTRHATLQGLLGFLNIVEKQAQLARDEICIFSVTCPSTHIDNVERGVNQSANSGQLVKKQCWCFRRR